MPALIRPRSFGTMSLPHSSTDEKRSFDENEAAPIGGRLNCECRLLQAGGGLLRHYFEKVL